MNPFKNEMIRHIYATDILCSFLVAKNAYFNYREFDLDIDLVEAPHTCFFIGPVIHNTIKTCLKIVGQCGYEYVEKEMCRFAEDMS